MFRRIILASVSVLALMAAASAADMYGSTPVGPAGYKDAPSYPSWGGFFVGVNAGYGWSDSNDQLANNVVPFGGLTPSGGFGGGQIGYNWQVMWHPHLVLGVEADFQGANITDSAVDTHNNTFKSQLDWFGTVRGKLGYAIGRSLIYGTGGFAYGNVDNRAVTHTGNVFQNDGTDTGYALGVGVEHKFSPAWSIKAEYQYINLGANDPVNAAGLTYKAQIASQGGAATVNDDAFHTLRIGLNYRFPPGYEQLK